MGTRVKTEKKEMLIEGSYDHYLVTYLDGTFGLLHKSKLTDIIECNVHPEIFGIADIEQCWNGDESSYNYSKSD